ncbi:uncharacterized protein LOC130907198 [Corythoichthys intestinalis]|uniref:uncharacterized protein LOC130907198 n=1 Tax=Corythoichthys intestinalis TaxID=161448 RepID=UPI0025A6473E|nr:uncharacterized protein LOC130907198 [Corythoichthys intestinalis]
MFDNGGDFELNRKQQSEQTNHSPFPPRHMRRRDAYDVADGGASQATAEGWLLARLKDIVSFIINVYFPCWFQVKVNNSWVDGPRNVLFELSCLRTQPKGEVFQSSPGHLDFPFYGLVCYGDRGTELSICPLPTAHQLHPDILDQLVDAVVPPIHPILQQPLFLQVDAMPPRRVGSSVCIIGSPGPVTSARLVPASCLVLGPISIGVINKKVQQFNSNMFGYKVFS